MIADGSLDEKSRVRVAPEETPPAPPARRRGRSQRPRRAPTARGAEPPSAEGDNAAGDDEAPTLQAAAFAPVDAAHPAEPPPAPRDFPNKHGRRRLRRTMTRPPTAAG